MESPTAFAALDRRGPGRSRIEPPLVAHSVCRLGPKLGSMASGRRFDEPNYLGMEQSDWAMCGRSLAEFDPNQEQHVDKRDDGDIKVRDAHATFL